MKLPTVHGYIDRRVLVNFTAEIEDVKKIIPPPFRPKNYKGKAVVGICLIRLKHLKPKGLPDFMGIASENGAHRIAVEWDEDGVIREGVYIPRRDTTLCFNAWAGGRIFPGIHHLAKFNVIEGNGNYHIDFTSDDNTTISIDAAESTVFRSNGMFGSLQEASDFFEKGALGYSPAGNKFEGLKLQTYQWEVKPLEVSAVSSSFFSDKSIFPEGSVQFDNALLMTKVEHEWHSMGDKCC